MFPICTFRSVRAIFCCWVRSMADDNPKLTEAETERRRDEVLKRMLNTPPKPLRAKEKGREPKPAPKEE